MNWKHFLNICCIDGCFNKADNPSPCCKECNTELDKTRTPQPVSAAAAQALETHFIAISKTEKK